MKKDVDLLSPIPLKKKTPSARHRRLLLLAVSLLLLTTVILLLNLLQQEEQEDIPSPSTYGELIAHDGSEVQSIRVSLQGQMPWCIQRQPDGSFTLEGHQAFTVAEDVQASLLMAASVISYEEILAQSPEEYQDRLADFGLKDPRLTMTVGYTDGTAMTIHIGDRSGFADETWSYMLAEGDDRLFALDKGTVDILSLSEENLHPVEQPVIHKARISGIRWTNAVGSPLAAWSLQGRITDQDANLAWTMTSPWQYPADSTALNSLRTNLANLRFGAYIGEATPENLTRYGFDQPESVLTIDMQAGTINQTDETGAIHPVEWPASAVTLTIGGKKNDNVSYVRYGDAIYTASRFTLDVFLKLDPMNTVSRYPVGTALADLQSLTIEDQEGSVIYVLTREEQLQERGEPLPDEDGSPVQTVTLTRNGVPCSYEAFEAAYMRLENVTVSGVLPTDHGVLEADAHTRFIMKTLEGKEHTISLAAFDPLHDAVFVDGCALFYLIRDGMSITFPEE